MTAKAPNTNKSLKKFFELFGFSEEMTISMALSALCALMTTLWMKGPYADRKLTTWIILGAVFSAVFVLSFFWLYNRYLKGINWRYRKEGATNPNSPVESESQKELRENVRQMQREERG
jgi:Na+/melibiose symporter-like transporter